MGILIKYEAAQRGLQTALSQNQGRVRPFQGGARELSQPRLNGTTHYHATSRPLRSGPSPPRSPPTGRASHHHFPLSGRLRTTRPSYGSPAHP